MSIKVFVDRPILSCVISAAILFVGIICLVALPVEQFPEIAPPTISVSASYTGANAETVQKSVVAPMEEAINGVENMIYMVSTASNNGSASIDVYFKQGTDGDMAQVNVQNRISQAQSKLPSDVTKSGVTVRKRQTSRIKYLVLYSPDDSYDDKFLSNYMKINIEPRLYRVAGVGEIETRGTDYAMRIWLDPAKMAQYNLVPSDIREVLGEQNFESPTGTIGADTDNTFRYVLKYRGRYETPEEFENMVIRAEQDGTVLLLKDVAKVEFGSKSYEYFGSANGHPGLLAMISQTPGSNANEIIIQINKVLDEIRKDLPRGIEIADLIDNKDFLDASIHSVFETLIEAIILVVFVVYVFLQSMRSSIIPALAIIISLVGTFAFMSIAGFSLNLITLFALVLVIGTVVDNAIVVVEAVQAKFEEGHTSAYTATNDAMRGITTALITTTIIFMAVFIPVSFMGGTTGTFYKQFGLTMAVAVGISLLVAVTLSPAMCGLILKPYQKKEPGKKINFSSRFHYWFEKHFSRLINTYQKGVVFMLKHKWITAILIVGCFWGLYWLLTTTKTGLVPQEDMGAINIDVQAPAGTNLLETHKIMDEIDRRLQTIPQIEMYSRTTGSGVLGGSGASNGMFIVRLKDWSERKNKEDQVDAIISQIYEKTADISSAKILALTRNMIPGYGATSGFEVYVQDQKGGTMEELLDITTNFISKLNQREEIGRAATSFSMNFPQYLVEVDATRCKRNGVSPAAVLNTLAGYVGGNYASDINRFSKLYRVMVQASPDKRLDIESLNNMFVRNNKGVMSPLSQYITLTKVYGSQSMNRFNLFPAIKVNGAPAEGYSSGQAIKAIYEVADEVLPRGYGFEFGGMSREEASSSSSTVFIFIVCIIFIYMVLAAFYESLFIPVVILLSVPFGLLGGFLFAKMWGLENNIYLQVGLLMLIGLLAKTAILLTEYATTRRKEGMTIKDAALDAAKVRLRPILMTALTMIFGMLPLMFATGVGANGNISIGVGAVGGMLIGTLALLFLVPVLFVIFQNIEEKLMPRKNKEGNGAKESDGNKETQDTKESATVVQPSPAVE